jgi:phage tail tape-measure protein
MRILLCGVVGLGVLLCGFSAAGAATVHKKKGSSKTAPKASAAAGAARKRGAKKSPAVARTTWRNRQMAPTPDRYKEIQQALVAKGYLQAEDANGGWNQNSVDALKRFQADQNIEASGKINSLSLIALGLGPKRDTASLKPAAEPAQSDR